ncbi:MAG: hypothetical protein N2B03_07350 [Boseongicola sp.]
MTSTVDTTGAAPASLTASLRPWPLFACSGVVLGVAILVPSIAWGVVVLGAAAGLFAAGGLIWAAQLRQAITQFFRFRHLRRFLTDDPSPAFLTDRSGRLLFANAGAVALGATPQTSIASTLRRYMASADGLVSRIAVATALKGTAT